MELRSTRFKIEYDKLQRILSEMGCYEEGMKLQEMREVLNALQLSAIESERNFLDSEMQRALRESQLGFLPNQDGRVLNSTMMSLDPNIPSCSCPTTHVVKAEVHHAMNWSPGTEQFQRKRFASTHNLVVDSESDEDNESIKPIEKRNKGTNNLEESVSSSTAQVDNLENRAQTSASILNVMPSSSSEFRVHDSGNETPHSSFHNESTSNLNNNNNNDNTHEIFGPVSMGRIHDSGVNTSNNMELAEASDVDSLRETSLETHVQISGSSDSEP